MKNNIYGYTREMLEEYFLQNNAKKYKAVQVFEWLYAQKQTNPLLFNNLSFDYRKKLNDEFSFDFIKIVTVQTGEDVQKFLFELLDGEKIEAVLMMHDYGNSV